MRQNNFDPEKNQDRRNQRNHESFEPAKAPVLQQQQQQHIRARQQNADHQRNMKEQLQRDRRADDFRQIARRNRDLREDPQRDSRRPAVTLAARLRQISLRRDAKFQRQALQQNRHQVRQHDDEQ